MAVAAVANRDDWPDNMLACTFQGVRKVRTAAHVAACPAQEAQQRMSICVCSGS